MPTVRESPAPAQYHAAVIDQVLREVVAGVHAAREAGVDCDLPDEVTIELGRAEGAVRVVVCVPLTPRPAAAENVQTAPYCLVKG